MNWIINILKPWGDSVYKIRSKQWKGPTDCGGTTQCLQSTSGAWVEMQSQGYNIWREIPCILYGHKNMHTWGSTCVHAYDTVEC